VSSRALRPFRRKLADNIECADKKTCNRTDLSRYFSCIHKPGSISSAPPAALLAFRSETTPKGPCKHRTTERQSDADSLEK
jgi:hypothetical protein